MTVHQEARVRRRARLRGSTAGRALAACMVGVVFSFPLAIMAIGSLRKPGLPPPGGLELLPDVIRSGNYETAAGLIPLGQQLLNSVLVVSTAVPVTVLVASWAGFAIVMARPAVRRLLIGIALVVLSMPASAMWVPRKVMLEQLGLTDHALVVALPAVMGTTPFYVLLFAFAYHRIPRSLYEVAAVEQASVFRIWRSVAFPLARPTMFAVAALAFATYWGNFIDPLILLSTEEDWPLALGLRALSALEPTLHPLYMAAAVMATAPAALAFLAAQRALAPRRNLET